MPFDPMPNVERVETTLGVLLRARRRVEQGWTQDKLQDHRAYCAVGGVRDDDARGHHADAVAYLHRALPPAPKRRWWQCWTGKTWRNLSTAENRLAMYNDTPGRTQREVLALYDRAIALCRADQGR